MNFEDSPILKEFQNTQNLFCLHEQILATQASLLKYKQSSTAIKLCAETFKDQPVQPLFHFANGK